MDKCAGKKVLRTALPENPRKLKLLPPKLVLKSPAASETSMRIAIPPGLPTTLYGRIIAPGISIVPVPYNVPTPSPRKSDP